MKKPFFSVPRTLILHALTTFLIGVGCVWPLSLSLGLTARLKNASSAAARLRCFSRCWTVCPAYARWPIRCCWQA